MTDPFFTRRKFLRTVILGGAIAPTVPSFVNRTFAALDGVAASSFTPVTGKDGTILVVLQLAGGNDGLNTVIPYADDAYFKARPGIAVPADKVIRIDDYCGLHPSLQNLAALQGEGHASIVQGVGYPNPNRSHFRATEIWQTASDADKNEAYGWLGRYCDAACPGEEPGAGIAIGDQIPQAMRSESGKAIAIGAPRDYQFQGGMDPAPMEADDDAAAPEGGSIDMLFGASHPDGNVADFLQRTALDAVASSAKVQDILSKSHPGADYPATDLGRRLQLVARLIGGGMTSRVFYVSLGGFDTHANQAGAHEKQLAVFDRAVGAFCRDMRDQGNFDRVLLLTFSEFGRRVAQNGSGGTDHGAAAPLFLFGGALKGGLHGKYPSLTKLERGDLVHHTDFRNVYATILESWLKTPSAAVLGKKFGSLPLFRS
ncbi:MAG: DUF1501 domain-containing protein [Chthoniobacterales bacterium]|nr:DUF1501 domain-containing protein [Chthoniobacterales bacterium]